jgi:hypothetical protein
MAYKRRLKSPDAPPQITKDTLCHTGESFSECMKRVSALGQAKRRDTLRKSLAGVFVPEEWASADLADSGRVAKKVVAFGDGCWEIPLPGKHRYNTVTIKGTHKMCHRMSYEWFTGHELPEGMCVCHRCDNTACVNPHHLFLGTHQANMRDMQDKGRAVKGSLSPKTTLTEEDVHAIKVLLDTGRRIIDIATFFNVGVACVTAIKDGRTWKHVA